ncbi:hypothetical protein IW261DRAFT_1606383 [Armillaria novae-zelandiae]|uniref:Uncharacterized protein n=1 Tax=Armillaria novae-zelandiae TaxID=153914 RepID=A0AA39PFA2_9AGAR|nr:hypothetical protein IW261DRAFT_1606383 [Armillaria novae-zelandiae]
MQRVVSARHEEDNHKAGTGCNNPSNYEDRFSEDPVYEETTPNARVWVTYQTESAIRNANMIEEIRDNVNVLLAGLFSLIVTTSVVSASLLFELLLVRREIANGSPVETIPISSLNPQTAFVPAATDVWPFSSSNGCITTLYPPLDLYVTGVLFDI